MWWFLQVPVIFFTIIIAFTYSFLLGSERLSASKALITLSLHFLTFKNGYSRVFHLEKLFIFGDFWKYPQILLFNKVVWWKLEPSF